MYFNSIIGFNLQSDSINISIHFNQDIVQMVRYILFAGKQVYFCKAYHLCKLKVQGEVNPQKQL